MTPFLWLVIYSAVVTPFAILMLPRIRVWTAPLYFILILGTICLMFVLPIFS